LIDLSSAGGGVENTGFQLSPARGREGEQIDDNEVGFLKTGCEERKSEPASPL